MLRYLKVSNLAIIDKVEVEFREGFNVLTGETGAGKSILIGALDLLLGGRASPDMIRTGEEEALVEGMFDIPRGHPLPEDLAEDVAETGELILSRRCSRGGRSRCSINGNLATVAMLQAVGNSLISIFGQHEHRVLLDPDEHIQILDAFGNLERLGQDVAEAYVAWTRSTRELADAAKRLEELERQERDNAAASQELSTAALKPGEEDQILQEREILKKATQIRERAYDSYQKLYSRSNSVIGELSEIKKSMEFLASANPALEKLQEDFDEARYRLEDVALELRAVSEKSHADPGKLEQLEERLASIRRLKKKYGKDLPGLIALLETLSKEAGDIIDARSQQKSLSAAAEQSRSVYLQCCRILSDARREAAVRLQASMKKELGELAMPAAQFAIELQPVPDEKGTARGLEKVEFQLASNPGEALRPLAKVASGGELSRIMLAIKALQAKQHGAGTVIFDEVDTGVGGHTAVAVGTRLARVAAQQQVLCVTHLHQIAALANHHLSVSKSVAKGRTRIRVTPLDTEERVEELARMLGASPASESVKEHVRSLMNLHVAEVP
jgi:DNA repair protein RecN (Recombination protein N)